jgi:hypothetical protein
VPDKVIIFTTVASVPLLNMVAMFTKVTNVLWPAVVRQTCQKCFALQTFPFLFLKSRSHWLPSRPPSLNSRRRPLIFPPPRVGVQRVSYPVGTGRSIPGGKVAGA